MAESISIRRRDSGKTDNSFDSLRSEAIKLIQQISGKTWTDYNLHDPGITILEQLIFSITDLIYRTEFSIQDYLAGDDGHIDLETQALYSPEEIFPCRPCTELDYRKLFLNEVSELDNVWIKPMPDSPGCAGLYRISAKLSQGLDDSAIEAAIEKIRKTYNRNRNLCEDIGELIVIKNVEYQLCANIEVDSARRPLDILADIYFECAQRVAKRVSITNYDELTVDTLPLEDLFSGPYTSHGCFRNYDLVEAEKEFAFSSLFSVINSIESVGYIRQLDLVNDKGEQFKDRENSTENVDQAFNLRLPKVAKDIKVVLTKNGRALDISFEELRAKIDEKNFKYFKSRSSPQNTSLLYKPIKGRKTFLTEYFSIQDQFPAAFGINAMGLPRSASPDDKARARQLKSYLVIFEQFLVNFLANIDSTKTLFSIKNESKRSYSFEALTPRNINDLEAVYPENPYQVFTPIIASFDDYNDRKSRLLDYLLSMYGERFTQNSLRNFAFYDSKDDIEETLVANKIAYLKSIVELGRDRAAAANYSAWQLRERTHSGIQLRVGMLLGFQQPAIKSLTGFLREQGLSPSASVDDERNVTEGDGRNIFTFEETGEYNLQSLPNHLQQEEVSMQELQQMFPGILVDDKSNINGELFRNGIYLDRYRVGNLKGETTAQLFFKIAGDQYWNLGSFVDKLLAVKAAIALRANLLQLNKKSEGLHVIEHILLRPQGTGSNQTEKTDFFTFRKFSASGEYFTFRVTVIFPSWTTRCFDNKFRRLAEETVRLNAPAQVYPEFLWLDFESMIEFESVYHNWSKLKSNQQSDPDELNDSAQQLYSFLVEHHPKSAVDD